MKFLLFLGVLLFLAFNIFLVALGFPAPLVRIPYELVTGWWRFLGRNLPQLTVNWSLIGMASVCSAILVGLGHWLLAAIYRQLRRAEAAPTGWRWRWTIIGYAGIWLLFAICLGATGLFQHTSWLLQEKKPWYQPWLNPYSELRSAEGAIQQILLENNGEIDKTRAAFQIFPATPRRAGSVELLSDRFDAILYANTNHQVEAWVLIPRDWDTAKARYFSVSAEQFQVLPLSDLQSTLVKLDSKYSNR